MKSFIKYFISITLLILLFLSCSKEKRSNKAAKKMQDFVINISTYAKKFKSNFIIIPQNGIELAFNDIDPDNSINYSYLNAIDGFGVEELFYNGTLSVDNYRLSMLQKLKTLKKIMVSEYVSDNNNISDAIVRNLNEGFICFIRTNNNYHYSLIPDSAICSNNNDIEKLSDAQNYLYLINTDIFLSKQDMLNAIATTNFDVVIIDLFFNEEELSSNDINKLKLKANGGKRLVISYISIGSAEKYRYYWKKTGGYIILSG